MNRSIAIVTFVALSASSLFGCAESSPDAADAELQPLTKAEADEVKELVKSFDPDSFALRFQALSESGEVEQVTLGNVVGLGNLSQVAVARDYAKEVSSTVAAVKESTQAVSPAVTVKQPEHTISATATTATQGAAANIPRTANADVIIINHDGNIGKRGTAEIAQDIAIRKLNTIFNRNLGL